MGIPFMDISNTVNSMVNDAVGIPPAAPEPSGPIDITDQCTFNGFVYGSGGGASFTIPKEYIGYYIEITTEWPNTTIKSATCTNIDNITNTINDSTIITKGILNNTAPYLNVSGRNVNNNPILTSIIVSKTEF